MAKKDEQVVSKLVFCPAEGSSLQPRESAPLGLGYDEGVPRSKGEELMIREERKQGRAIQGQGKTIKLALEVTADTNRTAMDVFYGTMVHHEGIRELSRGTNYEDAVVDFSQLLTNLQGRHELTILDIGGRVIGQEVARPIYVPEPPRRSLVARLLGE